LPENRKVNEPERYPVLVASSFHAAPFSRPAFGRAGWKVRENRSEQDAAFSFAFLHFILITMALTFN
jgi:hypothetical protein